MREWDIKEAMDMCGWEINIKKIIFLQKSAESGLLKVK